MAAEDTETQVPALIFDTDILIWRLRMHPGAVKLVEQVSPAERNLSAVSYLELLYGCRDMNDLKRLQKSVTGHFAQVVPITGGISESAVHLMEKYSLSRRPDTNDMLIAATALNMRETLVTGNRKHFEFIPGLDLKVFRP